MVEFAPKFAVDLIDLIEPIYFEEFSDGNRVDHSLLVTLIYFNENNCEKPSSAILGKTRQ